MTPAAILAALLSLYPCRPGRHTAYVARVAALAARLGGGR